MPSKRTPPPDPASPRQTCDRSPGSWGTAPLFIDLYELTMAQSQYEHGRVGLATFELVVRRLPHDWGMLIASGLGRALEVASKLGFSDRDVERLRGSRRFSAGFLETLRQLRFSGSVWALHEGCPVFAGEPLLSVTAPLPEAQLLETALLNAVQLPTLAASKAARCVHAARGRRVVDFAMRRAHGVDAAHEVTRSAWLAGMDGTSNVEAGLAFDVPLVGTMAHSYVLAFADEIEAFRAYALSFPKDCVLVVDTYNSTRGVENAARVAHEMRARGDELVGVRLDSGDLRAQAQAARAVLDGEGLQNVRIFASGGLDEYGIEALVDAAAPIDAFGVGTNLGAPPDAPTLDIAYKLVEYEKRPVAKWSPGKASVPGSKQVWRHVGDGVANADSVGRVSENVAGRALLQEFVRDGEVVREPLPLGAGRERCAEWVGEIPEAHRRIRAPEPYRVDVTPALLNIRAATERGS